VMSYLGVVPSEHSSGERRRRGRFCPMFCVRSG
jgi:hypothetical protein